MSEYSEELREVIASVVSSKGEVEVVRITHSQVDTLYLTGQLQNNTQVYDENSELQTVVAVPMDLSDESSGTLLLNERTLTMQGINDLIAHQEDQIDVDSDERVVIDVLTYIADIDGTLSTVARGPLRYYLQKTGYSQKNNNASLVISTSPTNISETGEIATKEKFPTLEGAEN